MSHQLGGTEYVPGSAYKNALKGESKVWYVQSARLVTCGKTQPTREQMIKDAMSVPTYTFTKDGRTGPTFWTEAKATRCVDAALGTLSEVAA